jgi:hypothetical protein
VSQSASGSRIAEEEVRLPDRSVFDDWSQVKSFNTESIP